MTIYSLDTLLSQFWISLLFHFQFCCFLTCIQVSQEAGKVVWYSHLLKNFLLEKMVGDGMATQCWSSGCVVLEWLWGDTPHPRAKEKPQQDCRRGEITFRFKPHTCQRSSEGSNIPCAHKDTETETDLCFSVSWGSVGQQWPATGAGALGAADLGMA